MAKPWAAIDWLSFIWKYEISDEIKCNIFIAIAVSIVLDRCGTWTLKTYIEKVRCDIYKYTVSGIEQIQEATPHKTAASWLHATYRKIPEER